MLTPSFFSPLRFPCKLLENRSGGTRTRTGDTMIFSQFPLTVTDRYGLRHTTAKRFSFSARGD